MDENEVIIWRQSFFKENFNVDNCLSKYTLKSDLETLRRDLKNYGNELHQQMAEILKTETEAIVNLAEYLTNLSSKIEDLSVPINQLREEIKMLYDLIKNIQVTYGNMLDAVRENSVKRNSFNLKHRILSTTAYIDAMIKNNQSDLINNPEILERAVNKFSFESNYLLSSGVIVIDIKEIKDIEKSLTKMVNHAFVDAIRNQDEDTMLKCLKMYDNLSKQAEAERIYQTEIVRPSIAHLFTESYLDACNQNLEQVFKEAVGFIDGNISCLNEILKRNPELKSYNLILNSFWTEVDKQLREGLPHITAPGNPELFQKRFNSTWDFLFEISKSCGDQNLMWTNPTFQAHIKRFNLPVYFEIRFQQIAGRFETDAIVKPELELLLAPPSPPLALFAGGDVESFCCGHACDHVNFNLKISFSLWRALCQCFNADVFIENLADQFLKLSMLLLSRYLKWFDNIVQENREDQMMYALNDLKLLTNLIGNANSNVDKTVFKIMPDKIKQNMKDVFEMNAKVIAQVELKIKNHFVTVKSNESISHLQNVAAIPRLYRRTNRNAPKEPSNYINEAVQPVLKFYDKFKSKDEVEVILEQVVANVTKSYLTLVLDVLRSVFKTEESLRRLKSRNVNSGDELASRSADNMSDEVKIKQQIRIDVCYFVDKFTPLITPGGTAHVSLDELKTQTC